MGKHKATTKRKTVQQKPRDTSSKKRIIESYMLNDTLIKSGDCVFVTVKDKNKPDVAKVNQVFANEKGEVFFDITWYIWPEDTKQGKLGFEGKSEILSSNWSDTVSSESIEGKCTVHSLKDYQKLKIAGPDDLFSRMKYNHNNQAFYRNESLPVYYLCRWPYNLDYPVVFCEKCNDWFHPKCVGIKHKSEVKSLDKKWLCPKCRLPESGSTSKM